MRRALIEPGIVLGLSLGNLGAEAAGVKPAFLAVAALLVACYALALRRTEPEAWRQWGLRADNLRATAGPIGLITLGGLVACLAWAAACGRLPLPGSFWLIAAFYPIWGMAQQLLLNGLLARNLRGVLPEAAVIPLCAAAFAASHLPDLPVVALTLPAGAVWVWAFRRWPNVWLLGLGHGLVGAVAFYGVLGRDPLAALVGRF